MTTATISKEFTFSAAHHLRGLDPEHPCSRVHGHNYTVRLEVSGYTDEIGFVIDYRSLGFFKDLLDDELDHRDLNQVYGDGFNPTAENIANDLLDVFMASLQIDHAEAFKRLTAVSVAVSETPKTWATATTERLCDFPVSEAAANRAADHWAGHVVDPEVATAVSEDLVPLDPHDADSDRFRWNFDHDGTGK